MIVFKQFLVSLRHNATSHIEQDHLLQFDTTGLYIMYNTCIMCGEISMIFMYGAGYCNSHCLLTNEVHFMCSQH